MVLIQPPSASIERVFSQVALVVATTGDKGLDEIMKCYLLEKKNTWKLQWAINSVIYMFHRYPTLQFFLLGQIKVTKNRLKISKRYISTPKIGQNYLK